MSLKKKYNAKKKPPFGLVFFVLSNRGFTQTEMKNEHGKKKNLKWE